MSNIQKNAAKKIIEEFTWDDLVHEFEIVYSEVKSRTKEDM